MGGRLRAGGWTSRAGLQWVFLVTLLRKNSKNIKNLRRVAKVLFSSIEKSLANVMGCSSFFNLDNQYKLCLTNIFDNQVRHKGKRYSQSQVPHHLGLKAWNSRSLSVKKIFCHMFDNKFFSESPPFSAFFAFKKMITMYYDTISGTFRKTRPVKGRGTGE